MQKYTRQAKVTDLPQILAILRDARAQLKETGSSQWQGTYPAKDDIVSDIKAQNGYVFINGRVIAGYAAVIVGDDPTHQIIDGRWQNDVDPYATLHRVCFSSTYQGQGLAKQFMACILSLQYANGIRNFRIDTSKFNQLVQHIAKQTGFSYRGVIKVTGDQENPRRRAYELNSE